jgi:AcrR family transcriptional regulator
MSTRAPGRPRSAAADEAIIAGTLALLVEDGYRALTMERVRERSGVGKATIYRRYASKEELVGAAIVHLNSDIPLPDDTGSLEGDFVATFKTVLGRAESTGALTLIPRLLAEVVDNAELHALFISNLVEPRRRVIRGIVRRAMARGEVRPDIDLDLAVDLIVGPMIYRLIVAGGEASKLGDQAAVVRTLVEGLRPR